MRSESCKLFAQLCESITEASTAMSLITGHPGGSQVIRKLHKDMGLAHDQEYRQIDKISWSDLKSNYKGSWVIIQGSNGTGAIKASGGTTGSYEAVASDGSDAKSMSDSRGGNVVEFLKSEIGKLQKFYTGRETGKVRDLKSKRRDRGQDASDARMDTNTLVKKFKPLWGRAISAAIADIKGHVANQIKNDAFNKAKKKLDQVERLQNAADALEAGSQEVSDTVKSAVGTAVMMAASHYYPEKTGDITRGYGGYSPQSHEGVRQLLSDLSNGDTKKLGTVLGFFKRTLISG